MELTPTVVHARLQELAKKDRRRKVFGAGSHNYRLNPPIDAEIVATFESQHGILLPEDYRRFLTEFGNGGAGPFYGLFPFGGDDNGPWAVAGLVGDVGQPFPHTESWNLDDEFWAREPQLDVGLSDEETDRLMEEWDKLLVPRYWNPSVVNGAIPICHLGCGIRQWLVVHGEQRGFVWTDFRADHAGLSPLKTSDGRQMTFSDWYRAWLKDPQMRMPTG